MYVQRFGAHITAGPGGRAVIVIPFDPLRWIDATTRRPDLLAAASLRW